MEKPKDTAEATICAFNGPNLHLLGTREPHNCGHASLADVEKLWEDTAAQFALQADCRRSNRDGELVDFVHEADARKAFGVAINTGAYAHASIARHDALRAVSLPALEVRISNICARAGLRDHAFTAMAACAVHAGFGIDGDRLAINGLAAKLGVKAIA